MNALAEFRQSVSDTRTATAAENRRQADVQAAAKRAELQAQVDKILPADLQQELHAQIITHDEQPRLVLTYRDTAGHFTRHEVSGAILGRIADWCDQVDAKIEKRAHKRANARAEVLEQAPIISSLRSLNHLRSIASNHGLTDDDVDVVVALDAAQERIEREKAQADRETIARLVTQAESATYTRELDEVKRYSGRYPQVEQALNQARERIERQVQEREAARLIARSEAFYPFVMYCVNYALVASEDGETYVETESIYSTHARPDPDGWYARLNPAHHPVQLAHVVLVERIIVQRPQDMPSNCPWQDTEFGQIHVPPPGCQRLQSVTEVNLLAEAVEVTE